ncbi:MAG TPA: transcription elongation factor GreA [Chloroflexi bacterium]|nr:transcription elongation factor GreA [Chloroflexota bacterium]
MNRRPVVYLTPEGYETLKRELEYLTTVRRQEVAQRLHNALEEGELIENAELEEARREQSFVEGRILELQEKLRNAEIIPTERENTGYVTLGSRVKIREHGASTEEEYLLVGSEEADPRSGRISNESPLGRALLGKRVGDRAVVQAPDGDIIFDILEID